MENNTENKEEVIAEKYATVKVDAIGRKWAEADEKDAFVECIQKLEPGTRIKVVVTKVVTKQEKKIVMLYDSREDFPYEDYVEHCEINNIEPTDENSQDYWDWVSETRNDYYDDLMENLSWTKIDSPVMVTGSLGLWDGKHEIFPVVMKSEGYGRKFYTCNYVGYETPSLKAAIKKCCEGRDTLDVEVKFEEDRFTVYAHHHDGCNVFEIRKLSDKGLRLADEAIENGEYCKPDETWFTPIKFEEIDF